MAFETDDFWTVGHHFVGLVSQLFSQCQTQVFGFQFGFSFFEVCLTLFYVQFWRREIRYYSRCSKFVFTSEFGKFEVSNYFRELEPTLHSFSERLYNKYAWLTPPLILICILLTLRSYHFCNTSFQCKYVLCVILPGNT